MRYKLYIYLALACFSCSVIVIIYVGVIRWSSDPESGVSQEVLESVVEDLLTRKDLSQIRDEQARVGRITTLVAILVDFDDGADDRRWPRDFAVNCKGWKVMRFEKFDKTKLSDSELPVIAVRIDRNDYMLGKPEFVLDGPVQVTVTHIGKDGSPIGIGSCFLSYYISGVGTASAEASFLGYLCH